MNFRNSTILLFTGLLMLSGCGASTTSPDTDIDTNSSATSAETTAVISADYNYSLDVPTTWETSNLDLKGANIFKAELTNITLEFTTETETYTVVPDAEELKSYNELLREDFDTDTTATLTAEGPTTIGGQTAYYVTWNWGSKKQYETTRTDTYYKGHYYVIQTTADLTLPQETLDALQTMLGSIKFL